MYHCQDKIKAIEVKEDQGDRQVLLAMQIIAESLNEYQWQDFVFELKGNEEFRQLIDIMKSKDMIF